MVPANPHDRVPGSKPHPDAVRNLVARIFESQASPNSERGRPRQAMQGDEPRLYGRFYWSAGLTAKWIVNDSIVEVFQRDGKKLKTIRLIAGE